MQGASDSDAKLVDPSDIPYKAGRLHDFDDDRIRPINMGLLVAPERPRGFDYGNQWGFTFHRTKLFWVVVVLSLSAGTVYARTRHVCQSFKNEGRFYYGMDVDRCVGVLVREPLASTEQHLAKLDESY